jgi:F0F1-type ATP synthase assembly protein I
MKLVIGITAFLVTFFLGACATQLNIQRKCSQISEKKADGSTMTTDNYVCE